MPQLKVSEPNVVVGLIDMLADREAFDDIAHHRKALAEVASLIKTDAHLQRRFGALILIAIVLRSDGLKLHARFVISPLAIEEMIPEPNMSLIPHLAARIAFHNRLPNLYGLGAQHRVERQQHQLFLIL